LPLCTATVATGVCPSTTRAVLELTVAQWVGTEAGRAVRPPIPVVSARLSRTAA